MVSKTHLKLFSMDAKTIEKYITKDNELECRRDGESYYSVNSPSCQCYPDDLIQE